MSSSPGSPLSSSLPGVPPLAVGTPLTGIGGIRQPPVRINAHASVSDAHASRLTSSRTTLFSGTSWTETTFLCSAGCRSHRPHQTTPGTVTGSALSASPLEHGFEAADPSYFFLDVGCH